MVQNTNDSSGVDAPPEASLREQVQEIHSDVQAVLEKLEKLGGREDPDQLLTREEAAERLRISVRTLDDMAEAGEIQPVRIRGRVLYHTETLEAYVRRRAEGERP